MKFRRLTAIVNVGSRYGDASRGGGACLRIGGRRLSARARPVGASPVLLVSSNPSSARPRLFGPQASPPYGGPPPPCRLRPSSEQAPRPRLAPTPAAIRPAPLFRTASAYRRIASWPAHSTTTSKSFAGKAPKSSVPAEVIDIRVRADRLLIPHSDSESRAAPSRSLWRPLRSAFEPPASG